MITKLITAPAAYPVTLNDAKRHLRIMLDDSTFDVQLSTHIAAVTEIAERFTNRRFVTQTWSGFINEFPSESFVQLPFGNLQSIEYFRYSDTEMSTTSLTDGIDFIVDTLSGRAVLGYGKSWPSTALYPVNPIEIRFICGYAGPTSIPDSIKQAILVGVADMFNNVESKIVMPGLMEIHDLKTFERLLWPFRIWL